MGYQLKNDFYFFVLCFLSVAIFCKLYKKFIQSKVHSLFSSQFEKNLQFGADVFSAGCFSLLSTLLIDCFGSTRFILGYYGIAFLLIFFGVLILMPRKFKLSDEWYIIDASFDEIILMKNGKKIQLKMKRYEGQVELPPI